MAITTDLEKFLLTCIDNADPSMGIQWNQVAAAVDMSNGGAQNKFRAIKKEWEGMKGGNSAAGPPATPKKGARKRKTDNDEDDDGTPKAKTPKTPKTPRITKAKAEKKAANKEEDVSDDADVSNDNEDQA